MHEQAAQLPIHGKRRLHRSQHLPVGLPSRVFQGQGRVPALQRQRVQRGPLPHRLHTHGGRPVRPMHQQQAAKLRVLERGVARHGQQLRMALRQGLLQVRCRRLHRLQHHDLPGRPVSRPLPCQVRQQVPAVYQGRRAKCGLHLGGLPFRHQHVPVGVPHRLLQELRGVQGMQHRHLSGGAVPRRLWPVQRRGVCALHGQARQRQLRRQRQPLQRQQLRVGLCLGLLPGRRCLRSVHRRPVRRRPVPRRVRRRRRRPLRRVHQPHPGSRVLHDSG